MRLILQPLINCRPKSFKKIEKSDIWKKVNTAAYSPVVTVSCGEHEEVFQINAITGEKVGFLLIEHPSTLIDYLGGFILALLGFLQRL